MWLLIRSTLAAAPFIFTPDVNHTPPPTPNPTGSFGGTAAALSRRAVPRGDGGRLAAARAGPADGGSGVLQEKVRQAREAVFVARKSRSGHFPVGSANGIHPNELFFDPARQQRVLDPALMSMPTSSMVQVTSARSGALTGTSF